MSHPPMNVEFLEFSVLPNNSFNLTDYNKFLHERALELQKLGAYHNKPIYLCTSSSSDCCLIYYEICRLIEKRNVTNHENPNFIPINVDNYSTISRYEYNTHTILKNHKTEQICLLNKSVVLLCDLYKVVVDNYVDRSNNVFTVLYGSNLQILYSLINYWQSTLVKNVSVFRYSTYNGCYSLSDENFNYQVSLNGNYINEHCDLVSRDMEDFRKYLRHYTILGCTQGLNYLLYGPPGCGKTSFVKKLVQDHSINVYIANLMHVSSNQISYVLSPKKNQNRIRNVTSTINESSQEKEIKEELDQNTKFRLILIEDFDRYIQNTGGNRSVSLSDILNALDGFDTDLFTIRIFTANLANRINDPALLSRFKRILYFGNPNEETIANHLYKVFKEDLKECDYEIIDEEVQYLAKLCVDKSVSMRNLNKYIIRYVSEKNPVRFAIENFTKFVEESNLIESSDLNKKSNENKSINESNIGDISFGTCDMSTDVYCGNYSDSDCDMITDSNICSGIDF